MPRFLCCHKSTPERILGGRIAESWHRADERGGRAMGHMRQRKAHRGDAARGKDERRRGGCPRLEMDAPKPLRSFNRAFPSRRRPRKEGRCRANRRDASLPTFVIADLPRGSRGLRAPACWPCLASLRRFLHLALRRNQRSSETRRRCSQIGEPRCALSALRSMAGLNRAGSRLNARTPSFLADEILFDQKSVTDRRSTRPNAPVGSVPAGDIAVRATRCSIFRASNRPWAQVK